MAGIVDTFVREPGAESVEQYARRVHRLAAAYVCLFVGSIVGALLLIWQGEFFVAMTQRSNVETLTIAFFVVLFGYLIVISASGSYGAARIAYFRWLRWRGSDWRAVERRKARALGTVASRPPVAALSAVVERNGAPGERFSLPIADEAGAVGSLVFDGAEIRHEERQGSGSTGMLAFAVRQLNQLHVGRGEGEWLQIVEWASIDDEAMARYLGQVRFARNLERQLGADALWPKVVLTDADCAALEQRLRQLCPALRDEAFLPDWEYSAEHKLPIIPEPLWLVSLSRSEKRADPMATMGCAVLVVLASVAIIGLLILFPPWVPGA